MGEDAALDLEVAVGVDLGGDARRGLRQLLHGGGRRLHRRAPGHVDVGHGDVAFHVGLEDELDPAAPEHARREEQCGDADGRGEIAPLERPLEAGSIDLVDEAPQAAGDGVLDTAPAGRDGVAGRPIDAGAVSEMGRQHEEALHEGEEQAQDHHDGDHPGHAPHGSGDEEHGGEGDHGGENAEDHGSGDALGAPDGAQQAVAAALLLGARVLAHHDGVVHHDAQHHDEAHQ